MPDERSTSDPGARTVVTSLVALSLLAPAVLAGGPALGFWSEDAKLVPDDGEGSDEFGGSADVDGNLAVVGAPGDDNANGDGAGAVYVLARTPAGTWTQQATLLAADGEGGGFGEAVSLDGDTVLVGAPFADDADGESTGAVYVFARRVPGAWTQEAKLLPADGENFDQFGEAVSLDGDRALVGAQLADNANGNAAGTSYLFVRDVVGTWTQQAELVAPDGTRGDQFGEAVSLDGDRALVGASSDDPGAEEAGSAYVLQESDGGWSVEAKLENPEPSDEDAFGEELSLDGDRALVAAPFDDGPRTDSGTAYVYALDEGGTWALEATLKASDAGFLDDFGASVSLDGDRVLVGAPRDTNANGFFAGAAYLFVRNDSVSWSQEAKLLASDGAGGDEFGASAGLDGGTALVGAPGDDNPNGDDAGAAYVYGNLVERVRDRVREAPGPAGAPADAAP